MSQYPIHRYASPLLLKPVVELFVFFSSVMLEIHHVKLTNARGCRAVFDGDVERLQALLADADAATVNEKDHLGNAPLHLAVYLGRSECISVIHPLFLPRPAFFSRAHPPFSSFSLLV